ncbi:DUF6731 family protein [Exiguobacterium sp. KJ 601]|uniref:DUF6731 family protein n=1 Tax=Exiguobacterium sp. KJ 601 TaxID=2782569 RepID=UPI0022B064E4|nr:DUF6731 family protein [Exiguobacterium sp. KJ 601]
MKKKYVRYEYYRVVYTDIDKTDHKRGLFKLDKLISKVKELPLGERAKKVRLESSRLDEHDEANNYHLLLFSRLKKSHFTKKGKLDSPLEDFDLEDDDYIGEEVCALYDPDMHVLMLQRNRDSLSPTGIQEYLNIMYQEVTGKTNYEIFLEPICTDDAKSRVKKSGIIKKIHVRIADKDIKKIVEKDKGLKGLVSGWSVYEAPYVDIILVNGRFKNQKIKREPVQELMDEILENPELIQKARLTIGDTSKPEVIDLLTDKATDFSQVHISEKIAEARAQLNHKVVWDLMIDIFHTGTENKKRKFDIQRYLTKGG